MYYGSEPEQLYTLIMLQLFMQLFHILQVTLMFCIIVEKQRT